MVDFRAIVVCVVPINGGNAGYALVPAQHKSAIVCGGIAKRA